MRSAKNSLRGAGDRLFAPPAGTGVHRCRPVAVLKVSCFTLSAPGAGVVACWQPKR